MIDFSTNLDEMAGFLTTALIGIAASVRAEAPPAQVWSSYKIVTGLVEGLAISDQSEVRCA